MALHTLRQYRLGDIQVKQPLSPAFHQIGYVLQVPGRHLNLSERTCQGCGRDGLDWTWRPGAYAECPACGEDQPL